VLSCAVRSNTTLPCMQAKDKVIKEVETAVKALKDDAKKHGELYVKFLKKAVEKVRLGVWLQACKSGSLGSLLGSFV